MDRSKSRLLYGLCLVAPILAGGRPDGRDDGEVHANLPFTLSAASAASAASSAASASPAKVMFSAIATMSHNSAPAVASGAPAQSSRHASPESARRVAKATPVKYTGQPSLIELTSGGVKTAASPSSAAAANSGKIPATTPGPSSSAAASKTTPYIDDWRTRMTWPPGCEEWANPCPQGAPLSGGGTARTLPNNFVPVGSQSGYVNPFTSYLTMTDANGVVTGMPPKATVPAGVTLASSAAAVPSKVASTVVIVPGKSAASGASTAASTLPKQSAGGSKGPAVSHNSASTLQAAGFALVAGMLGLVAILI